MRKEQVTGREIFRSAEFRPDTIDKEKRTIEVVWTTGARVLRMPWFDDPYYEELEVSSEAVRLERLNNGAPLLNLHRQWDLNNIVGVVERAWIQDGLGHAIVRFSERAEVESIWKDVEAGIIRNVSVGYKVHKYERQEKKEGEKYRTYRAIDWEPTEVSLVPIGADAGCGTRSAGESHAIEIIHSRSESGQDERGSEGMKTTTPAQSQAPGEGRSDAPQTAPVNVDEVRKAAIEAERKRAQGIMDAVRKAQLPLNFGEDLVGRGIELDEARGLIIDELAKRSEQSAGQNHVRVEVTRDEADTRRAAMENALLHRHDPSLHPLEEAGREYRGMSLLEMARASLEARGISTRGLDKNELAARALSTSDLPAVVANVASKTLRQAYGAAPQSFRPFVRVTEVPDFKDVSRVQFGDAPALEKVNENGEVKRGKISDAQETYKIKTYAKIVPITRQVLINDDLDAIARIPMLFGRAAADLESDLVYAILTGNPEMADGVVLFHTASHGNLAGSGAAISDTTVGAARTAMRKQTGLDGRLLNILPKYLLTPAAVETAAKKYLATNIIPTKSSDTNVYAPDLTLLVEPRLDVASATAYYLVADPSQIDTIELAYLQGQRGVYMETRQGFDVEGVELKARLDVGAKAIDHRGFWKNPG